MKYLITESKLEKVIFRYLDNQDFIQIKLSNPETQNIEVKLNTDYFEHIKTNNYDVVIFTGPIDSYFPNLEKLEYRSIDFNIEVIKNINFIRLMYYKT
jgi:UDP-galactopyranose mutase